MRTILPPPLLVLSKNFKNNYIKKVSKISLASNSEESGNEGGEPPRKKSRRGSLDNMQSPSNGCVQNGSAGSSNGTTENGHMEGAEAGPATVPLDQPNQDIVRLIGQYLKAEGLK